MEKKRPNTAERIAAGLERASDPDIIKVARAFMEDNGFKLTPVGKSVACNYVEQIMEEKRMPVEYSVAVQAAIMAL
jgi:hypothetical protein